MTVGGTRLMNSSGSSCAEIGVDHQKVNATIATKAPAPRRWNRPARVPATRRRSAVIARPPCAVFIRMFVSVLPGVCTAALRARWFNSSWPRWAIWPRSISVLDVRADGHLDDLARARRPERLGVQRQRAVGVDERVAVGVLTVGAIGRIVGDPDRDVHRAVDAAVRQHVAERPPRKELPLRVVRAPRGSPCRFPPGAGRSPCSVPQQSVTCRRPAAFFDSVDRAVDERGLRRRRTGCRSSAGSAAGPARRARPRHRPRTALPGCCGSCPRCASRCC